MAEERAKVILCTIDLRGIELSEEDRERVRSCDDLDRLAVWLDRAYEVKDAARCPERTDSEVATAAP
ncbi:hypothetical protein ACFWZ2_20725 [Streptomyces sp. NPDC059002]|uniref:hypothetical protein n=1 Tax=Streptomyces sp. NPDC059002 TaxID=3346690 RepID=UPI0036C71221